MKGKEKSALLYQRAWVGHIPEHFTGGSVLVSERGSSQMGVKAHILTFLKILFKHTIYEFVKKPQKRHSGKNRSEEPIEIT